MNIAVDNDEVVASFREAYPKEYSIVVLSILNQKQASRIAELEASLAELKPAEDKEAEETPKE